MWGIQTLLYLLERVVGTHSTAQAFRRHTGRPFTRMAVISLDVEPPQRPFRTQEFTSITSPLEPPLFLPTSYWPHCGRALPIPDALGLKPGAHPSATLLALSFLTLITALLVVPTFSNNANNNATSAAAYSIISVGSGRRPKTSKSVPRKSFFPPKALISTAGVSGR